MSVPCDGNVITILSLQQDDPTAVRSGKRSSLEGALVSQRWDLFTRQHTIIPMLDEAGQPIETDQDNNLYDVRAVRVRDEYHFVTKKGDTFAVDMTSDNTRYPLSIPSEKTFIPTVLQVSGTGVCVFEQDDDESVLTLSHQSRDGGGKCVLLMMGAVSRYLVKRDLLMGYRRSIESFVLYPDWDSGA